MSEQFEGEPSRQATASIAGYAYQVWWSLYAWLTLDPGESLYLERAEDFDVVSEETAEVVQTKNVERALTLTSADALQAITDWWGHRKRNPGRRVHLRFLTTAQAGVERSRAFGNEPGVIAWERAKRAGSALGSIRSFLEETSDLPEDLREYVRGSSDDELVREEIIRCVRWEFDQPQREDIRVLVEQRLVDICVPGFRVHVEEARRLAPTLLSNVVEAILEPAARQPLTYDRLLETLEGLLTERRPISQLRALDQLAVAVLGSMSAKSLGGQAVAVSLGYAAEFRPLETALPTGFVSRQPLTDQLAGTLRHDGVLVLRGSTGMGKSRLAELTVRSLPGHWLVLDLRGADAQQVVWRLNRACDAIRPGPAGALIDDLDLDNAAYSCEPALVRFLNGAKRAGWNVVLTTHSALPTRVMREAEIADAAIIPAPPFTESEVQLLAETNGCPPGMAAERWAKVIHMTTQGHPQLAHARVMALKGEAWPASDDRLFQALSEAGDLASVQRDARTRLQEALPSEEARTLAYRLSVMSGYFTRDLALRLAQTANPGEVFDRLCGPWVEGPSHGYYRVSPLLRGSAEAVLGVSGIAAARRDICRAIIERKELSAIEFSDLLFQSFMAGFELGLVVAALAAFQIPREYEKTTLTSVLWFSLLPEEKSLFPENPVTGLLLRHLQLRVRLASEVPIESVLDAADREVLAIGHGLGGAGTLQRVMLLCDILFRQCTVAPSRTIRYANEVLEIAARHPNLVPGAGSVAGRGVDFRRAVTHAVVFRPRNAGQLREVVRALRSLPASERATFVAELRKDAGHSIDLTMAALLGLEAAGGDGAALVATADEVSEVAVELGLADLEAAAIRLRAIAHAEYLNDPAGALRGLEAATARLGTNPILADYHAMTLAALGRHEEALTLWLAVLPSWRDADATRMYSLRHAGMAAARLGRHGVAGEMFRAARELAGFHGPVTLKAGLRAEEALSLWHEGERGAAVAGFVEVLREVEEAQRQEGEGGLQALLKRVGHALLWMLVDANGLDMFEQARVAEPPAGRLSEVGSDDAAVAPAGDAGAHWGLLAALEMEADSGHVAMEEWKRRKGATESAVDSQVELARVRRAFRDSELKGLMEGVRELGRHYGAMPAAQGEVRPGTRGEFMVDALAAALTCHASARGDLRTLPVESWLEQVKGMVPAEPELGAWLGTVGSLAEGASASTILRSETATGAGRVAAAAFCIASPGAVGDLYIASAILVNAYRRSIWRTAVEGVLAWRLTVAWEAAVREQRFEFNSPRTVVPGMEAALAGSSHGLVKCAQLLVAVRLGVSERLSTKFLKIIDEVAQEAPRSRGHA